MTVFEETDRIQKATTAWGAVFPAEAGSLGEWWRSPTKHTGSTCVNVAGVLTQNSVGAFKSVVFNGYSEQKSLPATKSRYPLLSECTATECRDDPAFSWDSVDVSHQCFNLSSHGVTCEKTKALIPNPRGWGYYSQSSNESYECCSIIYSLRKILFICPLILWGNPEKHPSRTCCDSAGVNTGDNGRSRWSR